APTARPPTTRSSAARPSTPRPAARSHGQAATATRVKPRNLATFVALTVFAFCASTRAATPEALARFSEAQAAFEAEDFSRARALFEQAQAYGMDGPAIHYDIGAA